MSHMSCVRWPGGTYDFTCHGFNSHDGPNFVWEQCSLKILFVQRQGGPQAQISLNLPSRTPSTKFGGCFPSHISTSGGPILMLK